MAAGMNDDDWSREADRAGRDWSTPMETSTKAPQGGQLTNAILIIVLLAVLCWLGTIGYHLYLDGHR